MQQKFGNYVTLDVFTKFREKAEKHLEGHVEVRRQ